MLGRLSQFKNFVSQAVTSLTSQRPTPPSDPQLESKLKFLLDYILRNPTEDQFKVYHSLQSPEMAINQLLKQIYHSDSADTTQISSILHFFTFLLLNCNNQLVLCKIVSDSFVVELTEVSLSTLGKDINNQIADVEEINSYKIALIKAYVSRIGEETIKYMVINDRMRIFENCVTLYEEYMRVEGEEQIGVEGTCISNCILLMIRYLAANPEHSPNFCYQEGQKGIVYLLVRMVQNVHRSIITVLNSNELEEQQFQLLKDRILFLVDILSSISNQAIKIKIISETSKELTDLRDLFRQIVLQHTSVFGQPQEHYIKSLELIKVLLKLITIYYDSEALLPLFSECLLPLLHKFTSLFKIGCKSMIQELQKLRQENEVHELKEKEVETCIWHKEKLVYMFCSNMEIVGSMLRGGDYLKRRNSSHNKEKQFKALIINILIDLMEMILGEEGDSIKELLCYKSVKCMLLSLMQLTVQHQETLYEYSVLKFHQFVIEKLRKQLKKAELWDYIVLQYESFVKMVNQNLLFIDQSSPLEYTYCQFHDSSRMRVPSPLDTLTNALLMNQCARNFRFMIVEKTKVSQKDIKLEKNYHNNFITPGWSYEPGKDITDPVNPICSLNHLSGGLKLPITVIQDDDCLLFAHLEEDNLKILMNLRFKSIEGFTVEKETMHIKLKGLQEVLVEPISKKEKEPLKKFKEYLGQRRDKARERELTFIEKYLKLYYQDNEALITAMGEADIEGQWGSEENGQKAEKEGKGNEGGVVEIIVDEF